MLSGPNFRLRAWRAALVPAALVVAFGVAGCGSEIGDECSQNIDCANDATRICDRTSDLDGYCTIVGCDHDTCPDEAVCVRFFTGVFENKACDSATEDIATDMCTPDEVCSLQGYCALRSSESRYCMRACEDGDDCRDGYRCRNLDDMKNYGGEPVLPAGKKVGNDPTRFCAWTPR